MDFSKVLSLEFNINLQHSQNIISLIEEGNTIPFIARYRKEMTGSCDDQVLREFADRLTYLKNLEKRKEEVISSITDQGLMTDEILSNIKEAVTQSQVEDIYRPFKPKRKTRASEAIRKGLKPLAEILLQQTEVNIKEKANDYLTDEVVNVDEAIKGAQDIIAEMISDSTEVRVIEKELFVKSAKIECEFVENDKSKTYENYINFSQEIKLIPSHRILAINRGEKDECLKVSIKIDAELAKKPIYDLFLKGDINHLTEIQTYVFEAINDGYDRLLFPSLEREIRNDLTDKANEQAIKMFETNLKPLLMQPPLKNKVVMGFDPAYRTGCKIAVVDDCGKVLDKCVVYPTPPQSKTAEAIQKLDELINKHKIDVISIGNGTASKESEIFVSELIKTAPRKVSYIMTNEAGASVYSASKLGAEEFPDFDVAERSAVSIARRLQDPLAELIKIDVKSIGVGQYQHDMPQNRLGEVLGWVVEDCVNSVGVDLNTASKSLLSFVSGLNAGIAGNIVKYRQENGAFTSRTQLSKVAKLGPKAYEQCAGFLRIIDGKNILDNTAVHPESYEFVKRLLEHYSYTLDDVKNNNLELLKLKVEQEGYKKVAAILGIGEPTLVDIIDEILRPGRDIRDSLPQPVLRSDVLDIKDLKPNMIFTGTVRNVIDFGAFVDIGVHQDGLVHISQICDHFIKHPSEELKVGDIVKVKILSVDLDKNRISLTMKNIEE